MNTTRRGFLGWLAALVGGCYASRSAEPERCLQVTSLRAENGWQPVEAEPACEPWNVADECPSCRAKPGSPALCSECLYRRDLRHAGYSAAMQRKRVNLDDMRELYDLAHAAYYGQPFPAKDKAPGS